MSVTGVDGVPQRVSTALSDVAAGTVAAFAIAAALVRQQRTGQGEVVDVSLLEADLAFMSPRIASFLAGEPEPKPCGGADSVVAIYQSMRTSDRTIVVALGNDNHWLRACARTGAGRTWPTVTDLEHQRRAPRPPTGGRGRVPGAARDDAVERTRSKLLQDVGVPCAPINYLSEVVSDPQVVARRAIVELRAPGRRRLPRRRRTVAACLGSA